MAHLALLQVDHLTVRTLLRLPFWMIGTVLLFFWVPIILPIIVVKSIGGWHYSVPSGSMRPTLEPGDAILALKYDQSEAPRRGTIYVYKHPKRDVEFLGRAIALPGDRVRMASGVLHINGTAVRREQVEDYVRIDTYPVRTPGADCDRIESGGYRCVVVQFEEALGSDRTYRTLDIGETPADTTPETTVPSGHVFMLGDNRDNSVDSRFSSVGMIPIANIKHEPWVYYLSWDAPIRSFSKLFRPI